MLVKSVEWKYNINSETHDFTKNTHVYNNKSKHETSETSTTSSECSDYYAIHSTEQWWGCSNILQGSLRKKCPYSELFWSIFSPNEGKYGPE